MKTFVKSIVDEVDYIITERRANSLIKEGFNSIAAYYIAEEERLKVPFVRVRYIECLICGGGK